MELVVRQGKGGRDRVVPVDAELTHWRLQWDAVRPQASRTLFCTLAGGPLSPRHIQQVAKRVAEKAGLDPAEMTPHVFRHTYATELLDEGFTIREVQQLLGHAHVNTTQVYTHVRPRDLADKVRARTASPPAASEQADAQDPLLQALLSAVSTMTPEQRASLRDALSVVE